MEHDAEVKQFAELTRQSFPEAAAKADDVLRCRGFDSNDEAYIIWFECLAEVTNQKMRSAESEAVEKLFGFFSEQLTSASPPVKECIDVGYVENLFWQVPENTLKQFWPALPSRLKRLYSDFHGSAPL